MTKNFGDTLLVLPVEPMPVDEVYDARRTLPTHITLQPWFESPQGSQGAFMNALQNRLFEQVAFTVERGEATVFDGIKTVDLIGRNWSNIDQLHSDIGNLITRFGGHLHPDLAERVYRPHVTRGQHGLIVPEQLVVRGLQFVTRQANGNKLIGRYYGFLKDSREAAS